VRIVALAHAYPRWDGDVAGAFIERLCLGLRARSMTPVLIVPSDLGDAGRTSQKGIDVRRVRYATASGETLAFRGQMAETARGVLGISRFGSMVASLGWATIEEVRRSETALVHAHWWVPGGISAMLASLATHKRFVVTLHGTDVAILKSSAVARRLAKFVLRRASAITTVSSYLAEQAAAVAGIDLNEVVVQPMPLEVDRYSRASIGGDGVVTVGRLVKQKNISTVIEAVAILARNGREVPLKVVGDGPERSSLEYLANQLGIGDHTQFTGSVAPEEIPQVIGNADVFAFPAEHEGLGLAVAESLMVGVPVVATKAGGGVRDLVPDTGAGRLVDRADPALLASAIEALIDQPTARKKAALKGAELKQKLRSESVAAVFENVYLEALSRE